MKFLKDNKIAAVIIACLMVVLLGGVAYAATFSKQLPTHGNIVAPSGQIETYADEAGNSPVSEIAWGDVLQGQSVSYSFYVKNLGNMNLTNVAITSNIDTNYATLTFDNSSFALDKGASKMVTATLAAKSSGSTGAISPTITITGTY